MPQKEHSAWTIPRNLRGHFRGFGEVGDVRDRAFQHLKIDFSTLNLGVPILVRFVPILVRRLVNIGPGQYRYGRIDWLSRSGAEPGCLGGLVRRRSFALLGTRVQAPAPPSPKIFQKSSKSEKILDLDPLCTNFGTIRTNFGTPVPILVRSVPILVRSAPGRNEPLRAMRRRAEAFYVRFRWVLGAFYVGFRCVLRAFWVRFRWVLGAF